MGYHTEDERPKKETPTTSSEVESFMNWVESYAESYAANYEDMFVWTTDEVARCCGVTRDTVYKWVSQGKIARAKRDGRDYFRPRDAKRMARRRF